MADVKILTGLQLIAKEFLEMVSGELDPHTKRKGVIIVEDDQVILLTPSHVQFAKYGRGPGKKPPLDSILEWVKEGRIQFRNPKGKFTSYRGTAFAIQASIGLKGTKNWVPNAPNAMEEAITNNFDKYSEKLGGMIAIRISDEVNKIYKDFIPQKKEFKI